MQESVKEGYPRVMIPSWPLRSQPLIGAQEFELQHDLLCLYIDCSGIDWKRRDRRAMVATSDTPNSLIGIPLFVQEGTTKHGPPRLIRYQNIYVFVQKVYSSKFHYGPRVFLYGREYIGPRNSYMRMNTSRYICKWAPTSDMEATK